MQIEYRIVINAPAERIFAYMFNFEHEKLDVNREPSVIANITRDNFFKRTILKIMRRVQLSSNLFHFAFTELDPYRTISFSPTHWCGKLYLPRLAYEFDEFAGRTEVISRITMPFGLLNARLRRRRVRWIQNALMEQSDRIKSRMERYQETPLN
jgi:hypothetical protein